MAFPSLKPENADVCLPDCMWWYLDRKAEAEEEAKKKEDGSQKVEAAASIA